MSDGSWLVRLSPRILRFAYFYTVAIGIISLRYDFATRKIVKSTGFKLYALFMNCVLVGTSPLALQFAIRSTYIYKGNSLVHLITASNIVLLMGVVAMTVVSRWLREHFAKDFVEQLAALETDFFDGQPTDAALEERHARLLCLKFFCVCFQSGAFVISVLAFNQELWVGLLQSLNVVSTLNVLQGVLMHYYVALLHLWKRFCVLNQGLAEVVATLQQAAAHGDMRRGQNRRSLQQLQRALAAEVATLGQVHRQLARLTEALNAHHRYQIVGLLMWRFANHVVMGYFAVLLFTGRTVVEFSYVYVLCGGTLYCLMLVDLVLVDVVCDALEEAQRDMAALMRHLHEFTAMERQLEEACSLLSQQLRQHKVRIHIGGMLYLNKETSFAILSGILQNTIVLVQWDFHLHRAGQT